MQKHENIALSDIAYYKIGGTADYVLEISSVDDLHEALTFIKEKNINRIQVLGLASNIILPEKHFSGAVLWMHGKGDSFQKITDTSISVFAGESVDYVINQSLSNGLIGLEWAGGLPSTVGGAVRGNAGAFGSETKDTVSKVEAIDLLKLEEGTKVFSNTDAHFSYRHSYFKDYSSLIITTVTFELRVATEDELTKAREVYQKNITYRQTHHPMEYPSCGSVFKNIIDPQNVEKILRIWPDVSTLSKEKWHNKISMGYVINRLGFSGKQVGGAQVSPKHTNYIVNKDHATSKDVVTLMEQISDAFFQTFGFYPEPEVVVQT
jgi:UDP-N-acetylmuramate dehydrogenase